MKKTKNESNRVRVRIVILHDFRIDRLGVLLNQIVAGWTKVNLIYFAGRVALVVSGVPDTYVRFTLGMLKGYSGEKMYTGEILTSETIIDYDKDLAQFNVSFWKYYVGRLTRKFPGGVCYFCPKDNDYVW